MKRFIKVIAFVLICAILSKTSTVEAAASKSTAKTTTVSPYQIKVNRIANCVTVYKMDLTGNYEPYRSFACSVGKNIYETPLGTYKTSDYYDWRLMVDGTYAQYAVRIYKGILFHSVPYLSPSPDTLEADQFNLLGEYASLGCIRLCTADAKWIYDNIPQNTEVIIYDDALNPGPLGKPTMMKTWENTTISGWDPTDTRANNPWNLIKPSIYLKYDFGNDYLYVIQGTDLSNIKAYIGCQSYTGEQLSNEDYEVYINGNYDLTKTGTYKVWVYVTDNLGLMTQKEYTMIVISATK